MSRLVVLTSCPPIGYSRAMLRFLAPIAAAALIASPAWPLDNSADYPSQPIRVIVTVPAGGGVDAVTRIVADKLRQRLGQPVVVENRGGQAGNFGAEAAFAAEPDGYTLMASQPAPLTVNALLYRKLNYDPAAFAPIAIMTTIPNTLTVRPDFPAKTAEDFIAYARANPGKLNYASQGTGTTSHLTAELFQSRTGIKMVHVPYKGTAPALNDLIAGHVDLMFTETRVRARAASRRQGPYSRRGRRGALTAAARRADLDRGRCARFRIRNLERDLGAAQDPGDDRRQAQPSHCRRAQRAGRARTSCYAQHPADRHDAGASRAIHQGRRATLGRCDSGGRRYGRLEHDPEKWTPVFGKDHAQTKG